MQESNSRTLLESRSSVETPEGVELILTPAGPMVRAVAYLIDSLIRFAIVFAFSMAFAGLGLFGRGLFLMILFLVEWFYPVLFEVFRQGATPGKRAMKLRVLHDNGTPVTFAGAMIRNLLRTVDILPIFYVAGAITMCMNSNFKRLGDLAAGTLVVYDPHKAPRPNLQVQGTRTLAMPLNVDDQRAIVGFAERCAFLSQSRQIELADQLTDLTGCRGTAAVDALQQVANGLVGRH